MVDDMIPWFDEINLPVDHRRALLLACSTLVDGCFNDITRIESEEARDWDIDGGFMTSHLPRKYRPYNTPLFLRQFCVCIITVGWKVAQDHPPPLACVAEELALRALITEAITWLDLDDKEADFGAVEETLFEDIDFEILFDPKLDGLEDSDVGTRLGMGFLAFHEWFKPFGEGSRGAVHPYMAEEQQHGF